MAQAFELDGDNVKAAWSGGRAIPDGTVACSEADLVQFESGGVFFRGTEIYKWTFIGGTLAAVTDPRGLGTWVAAGVGVTLGNGDVQYSLVQGGPEPFVDVSCPGVADGNRRFRFGRNYFDVVVASGQFSLQIATDVARDIRLGVSEELRMTNGLLITVSAGKL